MDDSLLERAEHQRLELEENIGKLRKSLRHWQTVEIDYEGLKEEFMVLPNDASYEDCFQAARGFEPELVNEKEIISLLGPKESRGRRPPQIIDLLSKRGDYVLQNVKTLRTQISNAEKKRNALLLAGDPEHREEAGLPLTEITEELDDSGQVISSKVETPAEDIPQLIKTLKTSGVSGFEDSNDENTATNDDHLSDQSDQEQELSGNKSKARGRHATGATPEANHQDPDDVSKQPLGSDLTRSGIEDTAPQKAFTNNPDDTAEEAALRQEMHSYGLEDVGAIVAELELAENASDVTFDEEGDVSDINSDYDEDDDTNDDESDDEIGRTKKLRISNKYRQKMEDLQKKLGMEEMKNLGPTPVLPAEVQSQLDRPSAADAAKKAAIARDNAGRKTSFKNKDEKILDEAGVESNKKKKRVAFANSLDIADESTDPKNLTKSKEISREHVPRPIEDNIMERSDAVNLNNSQPPKPGKTSAFQKTRTATPQTPMFPPPMDFPDTTSNPSPKESPDKIISDVLVERQLSKDESTAPPPDSNEIDEEIHRREIAMEYYRLRNKRIHQQGGFVGEGEEDNYGDEFAPIPIEDEMTGKTKKVSRFKAARIKS